MQHMPEGVWSTPDWQCMGLIRCSTRETCEWRVHRCGMIVVFRWFDLTVFWIMDDGTGGGGYRFIGFDIDSLDDWIVVWRIDHLGLIRELIGYSQLDVIGRMNLTFVSIGYQPPNAWTFFFFDGIFIDVDISFKFSRAKIIDILFDF